MNRVNVLVTGAGGIGHGSSILKALLLSKLNLNIVVTDMNPRLINTSLVKQKEIIPAANDPKYIDTIKKLIDKYSIDCIFTGSEQELVKMNTHKDELEEHTKVFMNSQDVIELCKNKILCNNKLEELGFSVPKSILINTLEDVEKITYLPVVLKPNFDSGASANLYVARSQEQLIFMITYLISQNIKVIAQEYIPFENNEYTVGVDSSLEDGNIVGSIVMRKFLEGTSKIATPKDFTISSGVSQGEFQEFKEIKESCEKIAKAIGSKGPLNIQLRVDNGLIKPFEINPRFSGTTSARAYTGYNQPEFYIRKYILKDSNAKDSLIQSKNGYVVKGLDEKFISYE
jgi:carbamoyl-phosphate synthase large subunit